MAESEGFESPAGQTCCGFQDRCLRPLGQLSVQGDNVANLGVSRQDIACLEFDEGGFLVVCHQNVSYLSKPLSKEDIEKQMAERGYVEGVVAFTLAELVEMNYDAFLDASERRLVGSVKYLGWMEFDVVGTAEDGRILIRVQGEAYDPEE